SLNTKTATMSEFVEQVDQIPLTPTDTSSTCRKLPPIDCDNPYPLNRSTYGIKGVLDPPASACSESDCSESEFSDSDCEAVTPVDEAPTTLQSSEAFDTTLCYDPNYDPTLDLSALGLQIGGEFGDLIKELSEHMKTYPNHSIEERIEPGLQA
ncbi:hypothetical protein FRC11_009130, partial [Ceratobasidium sp. 423]